MVKGLVSSAGTAGASQLAIFSISSRSSVSNLSIFLSEEKEKDSKTSTRGYCGDTDPGEAASRDRHTQVSPWPGASPASGHSHPSFDPKGFWCLRNRY